MTEERAAQARELYELNALLASPDPEAGTRPERRQPGAYIDALIRQEATETIQRVERAAETRVVVAFATAERLGHSAEACRAAGEDARQKFWHGLTGYRTAWEWLRAHGFNR
ncbi:MAG: hypothetical protein F4027_07655 [Rhodospirillaceae bacterium]|nr:hypothetical protein [Rhodospirillaceae bacterium]